MELSTWRAELKLAIASRKQTDIKRLILSDPKKRYCLIFNNLMAEVAPQDVDVAFLKPLTIIMCKIEAGKVSTVEGLFRLLYGIQKRISLNLIAKAGRRNNPLLSPRRFDESQNPMRLFSEDEIHVDQHPNPVLTAVEQLQQREELEALSRELTHMPELQLAVLREIRRFELEHRTRYKAFQAVALLAELDDDGNVTAIRPPDPEIPVRYKPAKSVVRQIHKIYQQALDYLG